MSITAGTVAAGEAIWRAIAPWKRIKQLRNRRRARRGLPLIPITQEDEKMLPRGTMTYTGIAVTAIGVGLRVFGIGECSVEEMATAVQACVDPTLIDRLASAVNELFEVGGLIVAAIGKRRAAKREAALHAVAATK